MSETSTPSAAAPAAVRPIHGLNSAWSAPAAERS